jgi:hypothetical protein
VPCHPSCHVLGQGTSPPAHFVPGGPENHATTCQAGSEPVKRKIPSSASNFKVKILNVIKHTNKHMKF